MEQSMKRNNLLAADEVRTFPLLDMPNAPDARKFKTDLSQAETVDVSRMTIKEAILDGVKCPELPQYPHHRRTIRLRPAVTVTS